MRHIYLSMSIEKELKARSGNCCELCGSTNALASLAVAPHGGSTITECIYACAICREQINQPESADSNHWRCLNDSMWSEHAPVQVVAYRMLYHLRSEGWPADLLEIMYLDEETLEWVKAGLPDENAVVHLDSNGNKLRAGDTVVLIQDLKVKGANFTAKRGTAVRRISLVQDNAEHIEGRVDGQQIVILTKYVKKSK